MPPARPALRVRATTARGGKTKPFPVSGMLPEDLQLLEDCALMERVRTGHRAAFEVLVRRHQRSLLNHFIRLGVQYDADDLVQQTFLRLYRYRDRYRPSAKLTTFLYLMARQVWIDEVRRRQRARRLRDRWLAEHGSEPADTRPGPAEPAAGAEVVQALEQLPEGARAVVNLGILQGLTYPEVAAVLHIPVGTVKSRMFHALRTLRRLLREDWEP